MDTKPTQQHVAFVDDSGNPVLDFKQSNVQQAFITTALIVRLDKVDETRERFREIRRAFFQTGEMAAEGVDSDRRLKILKRFQGVDFKFYAICVDKAKIRLDSGLVYKRSFLKHITSMLTYELHKMFPSLAVVYDEHGTQEFMDGFKNYLLCRHPEDIMFRSEFVSQPKVEFRSSKDDELLQATDFIAGTLLRCFDPRMKEPNAGLYLKCLEGKCAGSIDFWPKSFGGGQALSQDESFDETIAAYCEKTASDFIRHQMKKAPYKNRMLRVATVERLLHEMGSHYIHADDLVAGLLQEGIFLDGNMALAKNMLQRRAISKLRDGGVIIASGDDGYKLPTCLKDMIDYFKSIESKIAPQAARVGKARAQIMVTVQSD